LMELIVLNIGLELRVISPTLFAMLVIMAVVTTFATTPILHLLGTGHKEEEAPDERPQAGSGARKGVLVTLAHAQDRVPLVNLAVAAARPDEPPPRALALVERRRDSLHAGIGGLAAKTAPRSEVLARALEHARTRGVPLVGNAAWTDDPAEDIVRTADD